MLERKQYRKPPLLEVFCEFIFAPAEGAEWDSFLLPLFYQKLGPNNYPAKKELPRRRVRRSRPDRLSTTAQSVQKPSPGWYFHSRDENTIVQVGDGLLAINQLPPSYRWENFRQEILRITDAYFATWPVQHVREARLHYLDQINLPERDQVLLADYFEMLPTLPLSMENHGITRFGMSIEILGERKGENLRVAYQNQGEKDQSFRSFQFRWEYLSNQVMDARLQAIEDWLDRAYRHTSEAFRTTLTEKCAALFDEE